MFMFIRAAEIVLVLALTGGTGNHLLDYASTPAYWKAKGVAVSVDSMLKELAVAKAEDVGALLRDLGSDDPQVREQAGRKLLQKGESVLPQLQEAAKSTDPEVAASVKSIIEQINVSAKAAAVRRLMAVRTLGETKAKEALPTLRAMLESRDMFVPEYAGRAIAAIEGKPYRNAKVEDATRKRDLWLLPEDACLVAQDAVIGTEPVTLDQIAAAVPALPGLNKEQVLREVTKNVIEVAEQVGDVRLDAVTGGLSGQLGPEVGWGVVVFRGQYDSAAARAALRKLQVKSSRVGEMDVFEPDKDMALICPSNEQVVLIVGAKPEQLPIEIMVKATGTGKGTLANSKDMVKLLESVDTTADAFAVVKVTDSYRQAPVVQGFDTVTAVLRHKDKLAGFEVKGQGSDAQKVKDAVDFLNGQVREGINELKGEVQNRPMLKPALDFVQSIRCSADGKNATLTGSISTDAALIGGMMGAIVEPRGVPDEPKVPPPPPQQKTQ